MSVCKICGKKQEQGYNRPHSQHRTKRTIYPNVQKINGKNICMTCLRTSQRKVAKSS